jgi:hypothetical protein
MRNKDKAKQKIIIVFYLRLRSSRKHLMEIQAKGKEWETMLEQARGSHFESFMALKTIKELLVY